MKKHGIQFFKFGVVGLSNSIITFAVYSILVFFGIYHLSANVVGYCAGVVNSYVWNCKFVFKREQSKALFTKFIIVNIITLSINTVAIYVLIDILSFDKYFSQLLTIMISTVLNFTLNKLWTFTSMGTEGIFEDSQ